jgi:hypothetical protein
MLAAVAVAVALVVLNPPHTTSDHSPPARSQVALRHPPPFWYVRPGDTFGEIASKTGLTVDELQAFNPDVDPLNLIPGERLNLWRYPPKPRPKPLGPMFWTVRLGQSFGSIAARTGINIITLEALNPHLKPASLQPGDRVRLRR